MTPPARQLVNLTQHPIRVFMADHDAVVIEPSGILARVHDVMRVDTPLVVDGVAVPMMALLAHGEVTGLPGQVPGVLYIVSRVTAAALPDRPDLVFPMGEVRNAEGVQVGCRSLARFTTSDGG